MTTPFWCLLIAAVIPYALNFIGARLRTEQLGSFDNHHPRLQAAELRGAAARAYAAQQNAWEALAFFTAAVTVAHLAGADAGASATASVVFVVARVLHPIAYIADRVPLRPVIFTIGQLATLTLFALGARA